MRNKIFFSVAQGNELDGTNHIAALRRIRRFKPLLVNGMYKGAHESSFCLSLTRIELVESIAREFNQESILIVDAHGQAFLKYLSNGNTERLGKFARITRRKAETLDAWSSINGQFYSVE